MTLGGLLRHLAHVEDDYFSVRLLGREQGPPGDAVDWDADPDWDWHPAAEPAYFPLLSLHFQCPLGGSRRIVARWMVTIWAQLGTISGPHPIIGWTAWQEPDTTR